MSPRTFMPPIYFSIPLNLRLQSTIYDLSVAFLIKGQSGSCTKWKSQLSGSTSPPTNSETSESDSLSVACLLQNKEIPLKREKYMY